jgi:hypothetical protein
VTVLLSNQKARKRYTLIIQELYSHSEKNQIMPLLAREKFICQHTKLLPVNYQYGRHRVTDFKTKICTEYNYK